MSQDIQHLLVAMLAVGGHSLERVWELLPALEKEGLTDSQTVGGLDEGEIVRRLARSGYDRGPTVTPFMAQRLISLHAAVREGLFARACRLMREGRLQDAEAMLRCVKGIGPAVFKSFVILQGATR